MMVTRVTNGVDIGKLVKQRLNLGAPELDGLKGDEGFESKEDEIYEFEYDESDEGLGCTIGSTLTYQEGDKKWLGIPRRKDLESTR